MSGSASGPGVSRKGYTGHYQPEGLDYVMAPYRWYSPTMRGWLSRDPIGEAGGVNLYGYVANNPINWGDPLGLCPKEALSAAEMLERFGIRTTYLAAGFIGLRLAMADMDAINAAIPYLEPGGGPLYIDTPLSTVIGTALGNTRVPLKVWQDEDYTVHYTYFYGMEADDFSAFEANVW